VNFSVTPISGPAIVWNRFLKDTQNVTGQSCTRGIDKSKLKLSPYAKFIAALLEFWGGVELNPNDSLKDPGPALDHLYFSFLISAPESEFCGLPSLTDLKFLSVKVSSTGQWIALVSGSLGEWKKFIELSNKDSLTSTLLDFFNQMGLKNVFT
jgi:hypothetical protein